MRKSAVIFACTILMLLPAGLYAALQTPQLGKWWKNSEVAGALHLPVTRSSG